MKTVICYHTYGPVPCWDGTAAKFAMEHYFKPGSPDVVYVGVTYNKPFPLPLDEITGCLLFFVDFCYNNKQEQLMNDLIAHSEHTVIIDHHSGVEEYLQRLEKSWEGKLEVYFDLNESGASLTQKFLNEKFNTGLDLAMVAYAKDYDLWHHKLPNVLEYYEYFHFEGKDNLRSFEKVLDKELTTIIPSTRNVPELVVGSALLELKREQVKNAVENSFEIALTYNGTRYKGLAAFSPLNSASLVGEALSEKAGKGNFGASLFPGITETGELKFYVSLRYAWRVHGDTHCLDEIATQLGGGGHANASGCGFTYPQFREFTLLAQLSGDR